MENQKLSRAHIAVVFLLIAVQLLSDFLFAPALSRVALSLHVAHTHVGYLLSIYFLAYIVGMSIWGTLSEKFGRKPVLLVGLAGFVAACCLCYSAPSFSLLLGGRFIQGLFASSASVLPAASLRDRYSGLVRVSAFSLLTIAYSMGPSIGPVLGGALLVYADWRMSFVLAAMLGMLAIGVTAIWFPETRVVSEAKTEHAFFKTAMRIVKDPWAWSCAWLIAVVNIILFNLFGLMPDMWVRQYGLSMWQAGLLGVAAGSSGLWVSMVGRRLVDRLGPQHALKWGLWGTLVLCASFAALAGLGCLTPTSPKLSLLVMAVLIWLQILLGYAAVTPVCFHFIARDYQDVVGIASGVTGMMYVALTNVPAVLIERFYHQSIFRLWSMFVAAALLGCVLVYWVILPRYRSTVSV